jgi:Mrp family chromosome partitioning ATPase
MVEALKLAVQKARAMRARAGSQDQNGMSGVAVQAPLPQEQQQSDHDAVWAALETIRLSKSHLERNRLIAHERTDPAHAAFDVLRTKLLGVFSKKGWTRLGISSPGKGCGKTFTAANLALSLSRQADCRTLLVDMDLRAPSLARTLGVPVETPMAELLRGEVEPTDFLLCHNKNLALALNPKKVRDAAETILSASTASTLDKMHDLLAPDVVIYDLPPMLACDDVMGFLPQLDCVLLVVGGGKTRASDVTECERLLGDQTQLLGVILNEAEGVNKSQYGYGAD